VHAHKEAPESSKQRRRYNKKLVHSKAIISITLFLLQISLQTIMQQCAVVQISSKENIM
jgi:hypothetical protein